MSATRLTTANVFAAPPFEYGAKSSASAEGTTGKKIPKDAERINATAAKEAVADLANDFAASLLTPSRLVGMLRSGIKAAGGAIIDRRWRTD
jgi:hypothetical protein